MKHKALVCGGAGFIGSNLAKRLVCDGWNVFVVDNLRTGKREFIPSGARFIKENIGSNVVKSVIEKEKFDFIFHLAAAPSVPESVSMPTTSNYINVQQTLELMNFSKGNCGRFIFSSSSSVYGEPTILPTPVSHTKNPKSPYALQKSIIEDYCKLFGELYKMDTVCLRYFNVFGPHQAGNGAYANAISAWCYAIKNSLPMRSDGDGTQTRDLVFVDDVVEANILTALSQNKYHGECFNVGNGTAYSNSQILNQFKAHFPNSSVLQAPVRLGDVKHTLSNILETTKKLGYKPKVSLSDGLLKTFDWWGLKHE